jgi:hypothetical protein
MHVKLEAASITLDDEESRASLDRTPSGDRGVDHDVDA